MSALNQNQSKRVTNASPAHLSLHDRLMMIDTAYQAEDLVTCTKLIEDLYMFFDQAA